jgi:hypothetical protein
LLIGKPEDPREEALDVPQRIDIEALKRFVFAMASKIGCTVAGPGVSRPEPIKEWLDLAP